MHKVLYSLKLFFLKRVIYPILFLPLFGFGQGQVDCSLLSVTDVIIQNDSIIFEIFNADTMDTHYPYVSYTLGILGDTLQHGQMDWYVTLGESSSYYYYPIAFTSQQNPEAFIEAQYPLFIFFTYTNLTGENPGTYTCELLYYPNMEIENREFNTSKTLLKVIDVLGREKTFDTKNTLLFYIYSDGSVDKVFKY